MNPPQFDKIAVIGGVMRKKIPCKVIRSVSLSDDILFDSSPAANFSHIHINIDTPPSGFYTYSERLRKTQVPDDAVSVSRDGLA